VAGIAAALEGHDVSEALQRAGSAVLVAVQVLARGRESADHQLVDAHLFLCRFDGESAVQAFAHS
jgi:hypothetical protein